MTNEELKDLRAAIDAALDGKPLQHRHREHTKDKWVDAPPAGCCAWDVGNGWRLRSKPEPKTRPWAKPEDVPLNCWLRQIDGWSALVVGFFHYGVRIVGHEVIEVSWRDLTKYHYSTDRKTWLPCVVTEDSTNE